MTNVDPQIFRWLLVLVLVLNLTISGYHRNRARSKETIPRSAESLSLRLFRVALALPALLLMLAFVIYPPWIDWSSLAIPVWSRWFGVLLGLAVAPLNVWVLRSLGKNVSETVLTKESHALVQAGPYRWVRHPLYTSGFLMFGGVSLLAANWLMAALTLCALVLFSVVVIPREEAELVAKFGDRYAAYRRQSGRLLPRLVPARS
jgi:protein-S-isoprenylcysteine O-methyltransferase Ste14